MGENRKSYTPNQNIILIAQVNNICPLCTDSLMYEKKGKKYKNYEIAHIYPLNPKPDEIELLKNEELLHEDVNNEDNVIPLCKKCHRKFDKPRTVEEYRELLNIKKKLINESSQQVLWRDYKIEEEINEVIEALYSENIVEDECELTFIPKEIDKKLDSTISNPTKFKIKNNVTTYFQFIKNKLVHMDNASPGFSELISVQIKSYYVNQKNMGLEQQKIFENLVSWVLAKTKSKTSEPAEIIVSFFVQNCEVFE